MADVLNLNEFQTLDALKLREPDGVFISRPAGVYNRLMLIEGNSLLSSVYLHAIDAGATLEVKYFDTTTGDAAIGERFDLQSHEVMTSADVGSTDRITVTRIHNKPVLEATVTGGSATFGVFCTVVSSFATDLDAALILDGDTFEPDANKAIPIACLDEDSGELKFIRCNDGGMLVSGEAGDPFHVSARGTTVPDSSTTLTSFSVPAGKTRKFQQINVSCNLCGTFTLEAGGSIIASGRTGAGNPNSFFPWNPKRSVAAGTTVDLKFFQLDGSATDVDYHIMALDVDDA